MIKVECSVRQCLVGCTPFTQCSVHSAVCTVCTVCTVQCAQCSVHNFARCGTVHSAHLVQKVSTFYSQLTPHCKHFPQPTNCLYNWCRFIRIFCNYLDFMCCIVTNFCGICGWFQGIIASPNLKSFGTKVNGFIFWPVETGCPQLLSGLDVASC